MADQVNAAPDRPGGGGAEEPIPVGQIIFDDVFLWLMLGLLSPILLYLVWGLWETSVVPVLMP